MENTSLLDFIRNLATNIENNKLDTEQLVKVKDFKVFYEHVEQDDNTSEGKEEFDNAELLSFVVLGWYMYSMMKK